MTDGEIPNDEGNAKGELAVPSVMACSFLLQNFGFLSSLGISTFGITAPRVFHHKDFLPAISLTLFWLPFKIGLYPCGIMI